MIRNLQRKKELPDLIQRIVRTYRDADLHLQHLGEIPLPNESVVVVILNKLRNVLFPGYFGRESVTSRSVDYYCMRSTSSFLTRSARPSISPVSTRPRVTARIVSRRPKTPV